MTSADKGGGAPVWLRFVLSVAVLVFLFTQVDLSLLASKLTRARPAWLVLGVALMLSEQAVLAFWWSGMLTGKGFRASFAETLHIAFMADFLGFVMPSSLGSDVMKVAGLSRHISNTTEALSSLLMFRMLNYALMFFIALVTMLFFSGFFPDKAMKDVITVALAVCCAAGVAGLLFARRAMALAEALCARMNAPRVDEKLKSFYESLAYFKRNPRVTFGALAAGCVIQLNRIVYMYVIAMALSIDIDLAAFFVFVPIVTAVTMIPVSISGIGVREGGYVLLFGQVGLSASQALSLSIVGFALTIAPVLLGGVLYWISGFPAHRKLDDLK